MTQTWSKYTYVCSTCDSLIEFTCPDAFQPVTNITCPCNNSTVLLSVEDATIQPTETEGNKMEETSTVTVPDTYNPNLLVTYKVIRGYSDAEYATDKVVNLEWELHNGRERQKQNSLLHSQIDSVKEIIAEAYADSQDQDTLRAIAEALQIEITKTIEFTATVEVTGTIDIDLLSEWGGDFDSEIEENLYVESQAGNIEINEQYVTNVREA
jgi:DNA-directed RNA polymerase subunit RPC12/RpoP